ncbi:MAG: ABC transporter substrate-binding protein [Rhodothermales bacterium]
MRVVSLHPACTEWLVEIGAAHLLAGRSHECPQPFVPAVTRSDGAIDHEALDRLRPDIVLGPSEGMVLPDALNVEVMEFASLKQLLGSVLKLGRRIGAGQTAMQRIASYEARLKGMRDRAGLSNRAPKEQMPTALCITRLHPLTVGGRWIPDLVELAGGRPLLVATGEPSREVAWDEIRRADPDVLVFMVEGLSAEKALGEVRRLSSQPGWAGLAAVRRNRVMVLDGGTYFNIPGPRLYRGIELLIASFYPGLIHAESWEAYALTETVISARSIAE